MGLLSDAFCALPSFQYIGGGTKKQMSPNLPLGRDPEFRDMNEISGFRIVYQEFPRAP
jgi:hypothetical protein